LLWIRYSLLEKLIACMIEDWKKRDDSEERMMTRMVYISRRFSNLIIVSNAIGSILHATGTVLRHKNDNQTDARELIVKMELPFKIESTSTYIAVLVIQLVHLTCAASIAGVINSLLINLVSPNDYLSMFLKKVNWNVTPKRIWKYNKIIVCLVQINLKMWTHYRVKKHSQIELNICCDV